MADSGRVIGLHHPALNGRLLTPFKGNHPTIL